MKIPKKLKIGGHVIKVREEELKEIRQELDKLLEELNKLTPTRFELQEWRGIDNYGETTTL